MMSVRSGLCSNVSRIGARERIVTIWAVASLVKIVVVSGEVVGGSVVLESERRWRNSMDLLRSVMMSRLTVLGHNLLRCLWVCRATRAFVGMSCVAILSPSASRSCMASAMAMTSWRVLESIFGRGVYVFGSGVCRVLWRVLRFCSMVEVYGFVIVFISSFHCVSSGCGIEKWNFMDCLEKLSCL